MFIKHGDGKILSVMEEDELSEENKKAAKKSIKEIEQSKTDALEKQSGSK